MTSHTKKHGFTLVEVLMASVVTLILMGVMIRIFSSVGDEIAKGRALLEMAGHLRTAADLLRRDLAGKTTAGLSGYEPGGSAGYFEVLEGQGTDDTSSAGRQLTLQNGNNDTSGVFGDVDDVLMFTSQNFENPFRGRFQFYDAGGVLRTRIIESNYAEIIWWTVFDDRDNDGVFDADEPMRLYRRVLLIRPGIFDIMPLGATLPSSTDKNIFLQYSDISVRIEPTTGQLRPNSLSSLSRRENRFARGIVEAVPAANNFPHQVNVHETVGLPGGTALTVQRPSNVNENLNRYVLQKEFLLGDPNGPVGELNPYSGSGEDLILSGVAGFDIRVFDSTAVKSWIADPAVPGNAVAVLDPSDPAYSSGAAATQGTFVDLGYAHNLGLVNNSEFSGTPVAESMVAWGGAVFPNKRIYTYDTWSKSYYSDGINQDSDAAVDEPLEVFPPYPKPLRGIKVTIRLLEPKTQTVRQSSVVANFVPE